MINQEELIILKNFINMMPRTYRNKNCNHAVVRDILLSGTLTAGMTSCIEKCVKLGIDPYGHNFDLKGWENNKRKLY